MVCLHYYVDKPTFNYKGMIVIVIVTPISGYITTWEDSMIDC